jgi:methylmalonyl-CoA mutase cobalamin-binding subunit
MALLACLPDEHHDLGLIAFGLALRERGWRISYLGTNAPIDTVAEVAHQIGPAFVVLNGVSAERVRPIARKVRALARAHRVALGGSAAAGGALKGGGVTLLPGDPIEEAARLTSALGDVVAV